MGTVNMMSLLRLINCPCRVCQNPKKQARSRAAHEKRKSVEYVTQAAHREQQERTVTFRPYVLFVLFIVEPLSLIMRNRFHTIFFFFFFFQKRAGVLCCHLTGDFDYFVV